jgi:hypothetical protein
MFHSPPLARRTGHLAAFPSCARNLCKSPAVPQMVPANWNRESVETLQRMNSSPVNSRAEIVDRCFSGGGKSGYVVFLGQHRILLRMASPPGSMKT